MEFDADFIATVVAIVVPVCIAAAYIVRLEMRVKQLEKNKPTCEYCGYIAFDERELHNHQITCEKKKKKETKI